MERSTNPVDSDSHEETGESVAPEGIESPFGNAEGCSRRNKTGIRRYVCRYYHNGSWWGLDLTADDQADAEARVAKLGNLQLQGELMAEIPAKPGAGLLVRAICTMKNFFA